MNAFRRTRLAIVGAGPAGLAAAWKLRDVSRIDITVFEKSGGVFGRAATRTRHGLRLDPGANYFKTDLPEIAELVHARLPSDELIRIDGDIDVFDENGTISPGDAAMNAEHKWTYRSGINTLGKLLAQAARCSIAHGVRVGRVERVNRPPWRAGWQVTDDHGGDRGVFDAVLLALPAPQAIELLQQEDIEIAEALAPATYQSQWSFTFGFDHDPAAWPGHRYALINADRQHRIAWLSCENAKPGRVPQGMLAVMAQMQPQWSAANFARPAEALAHEAGGAIADLLGWRASDFRWFDCQRWKFSLPTGRADVDRLQQFEHQGLYVCGDTTTGKGRVGLALQSGFDVAQRLRRACYQAP